VAESLAVGNLRPESFSESEIQLSQSARFVEDHYVHTACFDQFLRGARVGLIPALLQLRDRPDYIAEDGHRQRNGHLSASQVPAEPYHHPEWLLPQQTRETEELGSETNHWVYYQLKHYIVAQKI